MRIVLGERGGNNCLEYNGTVERQPPECFRIHGGYYEASRKCWRIRQLSQTMLGLIAIRLISETNTMIQRIGARNLLPVPEVRAAPANHKPHHPQGWSQILDLQV